MIRQIVFCRPTLVDKHYFDVHILDLFLMETKALWVNKIFLHYYIFVLQVAQ